MTDTSTIEPTFTPVETIPAAVRAAGEGREPIKWEDKLAPLKAKQGEAFLCWAYEKKSAATSRVSAIRNRLFKNTPSDNWTLVVRPVPNSDPETFGVYVCFNGVFSDDEVAARNKARQERSDRISAAHAAARAADGAVGAEAPVESVQTPAERVAAAKRATAK